MSDGDKNQKKVKGSSLAHSTEVTPQVVDSAIVMDMVETYVGDERQRSRRVLQWFGAIFIFVVCLVLILFVSISIMIFQESKKSKKKIVNVQQQTADIGMEIEDISSGMQDLGEKQDDVTNKMKLVVFTEEERDKILRGDLKRFSEYVFTVLGNNDTGESSSLAERVKTMELSQKRKDQEIMVLREKLYNIEKSAQLSVSTASTRPVGPVVSTAGTAPVEPVETTVMVDDDLIAGLSEKLFAELPTELADLFEKRVNIMSKKLPDDSKYEGELWNGKPDGKGKLINGNGNTYIGDFKDGKKHGKGVFTFSNGDIYRGEFRNDVRNGRGAYIFIDGSTYIGHFTNGARDGRGRYIYASGAQYIGEFKDGLKDGYGVYVYPNGKQRKGLWQDNQFIKAVTE